MTENDEFFQINEITISKEEAFKFLYASLKLILPEVNSSVHPFYLRKDKNGVFFYNPPESLHAFRFYVETRTQTNSKSDFEKNLELGNMELPSFYINTNDDKFSQELEELSNIIF